MKMPTFFCKLLIYCTITEIGYLKLYYIKERKQMLKETVKETTELTKTRCPECGQEFEEKVKSHLVECDRCLAKKGE
jgi:protein-arginine kinase activator protein McsA